jgi:hypothetical protein
MKYVYFFITLCLSLSDLPLRASDVDEARMEIYRNATDELVSFNFNQSYQMFEKLRLDWEKNNQYYFQIVFCTAISSQHITPPVEHLVSSAYERWKCAREWGSSALLVKVSGENLA